MKLGLGLSHITKIQKRQSLSFLMFALVLLLGACSQSRLGIKKAKSATPDEIWKAQEVCQNAEGLDLLGCFSVQPNITQNNASIEVIDLGVDPMQNPFRVLARRAGDASFVLLMDNVRADKGRKFTVQPKKGQLIKDYDEWRFETTKAFAEDGMSLVTTASGKGIVMAWVHIDWPELATASASSSTKK